MNKRNLGSKERVKFEEGICTKFCLKLCLVIGIFVILLSQDGIESDYRETNFETITFLSQFEKVTVQRSTAELWTVISNQGTIIHAGITCKKILLQKSTEFGIFLK